LNFKTRFNNSKRKKTYLKEENLEKTT